MPTEVKKHSISMMNRMGDIVIEWDPENETEVEAAESTFADLREKGFLPFEKRGGGGEQIDAFDASIERIVFTAPMAGGQMQVVSVAYTPTVNTGPSAYTSEIIWTQAFGTSAYQIYGRAIYDQWISAGWRPPSPPLTAEQEAERRRAWRNARLDLVYDNRQRARELRRKFASRRATVLMCEFLNEEQRAEWEADKQFHVDTPAGRQYRIKHGMAGNVMLVAPGPAPPRLRHGDVLEPGHMLCAHVEYDEETGDELPFEDNMLAQKLVLESPGGEERFLAMANLHGRGEL